MTEDDAKTKWCPFARVLVADAKHQAAPHNRSALDHGRSTEQVDNPAYARCMGSACMAWRWVLNRDPSSLEIVKTEGYCGLAGAPQ